MTPGAGASKAGAGHRLNYMPGIDGLRTIAVASVVIYHLGAPWLPGGYLGVDVFLVISGFLITSLLLAEHRGSGRINLRRFWMRRARRLLPAVLVMMAVVLAYMLVMHAGEVGRLRGQVLAALAYVINWHFIFADVPYFEQFGRPSVLLHLWSLAIEEQFYLIWPPLLVLGLLALGRRAILGLVVLAAAGSTVLAWVLYEPFSDPSRIYYGTDTRAVALLVGVAIALVPAAIRSGGPVTGSRLRRRGRDVLGVLCAAGVLGFMFTLGDLDERLYQGGFLLVALATAGVVIVAADPTSVIGRALGTAPLVWLGLRSYGIYLWHWPVIMLTRPGVDVPLDGAALVALRVALTLAAAALSYRFVEVPFRRHGFAGLRRALGQGGGLLGRPVRIAAASSAVLAVAALVFAVALAPTQAVSVPGLSADARAGGQSEAPLVSDRDMAEPQLLFVGDSVMLGASSALQTAFGDRAIVDAATGRRFPEGAAIVKGHLRTLGPDTVVVIHLGNNYFVEPTQLEGLLSELADRPRVLLVTVRVPLPWQDSVNTAITDAAAAYPNVTVVDWFSRSSAPGLLVDGAHMNERGMRLYTEEIQAALDDAPDRR